MDKIIVDKEGNLLLAIRVPKHIIDKRDEKIRKSVGINRNPSPNSNAVIPYIR